MLGIAAITQWMDQLAPPGLAEAWDNVGLLVGDPTAGVSRVMTCLTITDATVAEAIAEQAELIVTHHPLPFRPVQRLTTETPEGRHLLNLAAARIAVYSAHTAYDSSGTGINQRLAEALSLDHIAPLVEHDEVALPAGKGRIGRLSPPKTLREVARALCEFLNTDAVQIVGDGDRSLEHVGIACGSAGEFLEPARRANCDALITGETSFHTCLAAEAEGMALILLGHYASERFAMVALAEDLDKAFPDVSCWASRQERDPLVWLSPSRTPKESSR